MKSYLFTFSSLVLDANINYAEDCLLSVPLPLGLCTQERSEAGRDPTSKHRVSNCHDTAHAIGPHLYAQVKEQIGLMH